MTEIKQTVREALARLVLPDGGDLVSRDMIRALSVENGVARFVIEAPSPEIASAVRNITLPAVYQILRRRGRRYGDARRMGGQGISAAEDARTLRAMLRRLRRSNIPLDCRLGGAMMSAALRCGHAKLALQTFEQLVTGGAEPDSDVRPATSDASPRLLSPSSPLALMRAAALHAPHASTRALAAIGSRGRCHTLVRTPSSGCQRLRPTLIHPTCVFTAGLHHPHSRV